MARMSTTIVIVYPSWAPALIAGMKRLRKIGIPVDAKLVAQTIAEACKYEVEKPRG